MNNCVIIHGCPSDKEKAMDADTRTFDKHWIPWAKRELEDRHIETVVPLMPEPWSPSYSAYKKLVDALAIDENTILIGHSCGSAFLVRWLGETKRKVHRLILVAPWVFTDGADQVKRKFYEYQIDGLVKDRVDDIVIFTSDNEEQEGKESARIFHEALGGRVIELSKHGHYTLEDMKTDEFPELINVILKI